MNNSFKKAYNDENKQRIEYQQQLIQQQKGFLHHQSQPFHPLQQISFMDKPVVQDIPEPKKRSTIDIDLIDELPQPSFINELPPVESTNSHLPFYINKQLHPVKPEYKAIPKTETENKLTEYTLKTSQSGTLSIPSVRESFLPLHQPGHQYAPSPYDLTDQPVPSRQMKETPTMMLPKPEKGNEVERDYVYKAFLLYFENPRFCKMNDIHDAYGLYYAKVTSMVHENRYLIVMTDKDYEPKGTIMTLQQLPWKSFQLRIIDAEFSVPEISYRKENNGVFDDEIILEKRDKISKKAIYQCKYNPLTVELLPSKKGTINDYPERATLEAAMDSFYCVLYFS